MTWIAVRTPRRSTGRPPIVSRSRAAFKFAGKITTSMTAASRAVTRAVAGTCKPEVMSSSAMPVTVTHKPALPNAAGTIRTRSGRRLPQCAEAVSRNMAPSAARSACCQSANQATPNPASQNPANATTSTIKGIIAPALHLLSNLSANESANPPRPYRGRQPANQQENSRPVPPRLASASPANSAKAVQSTP